MMKNLIKLLMVVALTENMSANMQDDIALAMQAQATKAAAEAKKASESSTQQTITVASSEPAKAVNVEENKIEVKAKNKVKYDGKNYLASSKNKGKWYYKTKDSKTVYVSDELATKFTAAAEAYKAPIKKKAISEKFVAKSAVYVEGDGVAYLKDNKTGKWTDKQTKKAITDKALIAKLDEAVKAKATGTTTKASETKKNADGTVTYKKITYTKVTDKKWTYKKNGKTYKAKADVVSILNAVK